MITHEVMTEGAFTRSGTPFIAYGHEGDLLIGIRFMENTIRKNIEGAKLVTWRQLPEISLNGDQWGFHYRFAAEK